jgi:hypothetical protein
VLSNNLAIKTIDTALQDPNFFVVVFAVCIDLNECFIANSQSFLFERRISVVGLS